MSIVAAFEAALGCREQRRRLRRGGVLAAAEATGGRRPDGERDEPPSTLQAPAGSPSSAAATAVPFSRRRGATSSSSGGDDIDRRRCNSRSRSQQQRRPWEASPVGVGLAGALNGDALPPVATSSTLVLTGQRIIRPCRSRRVLSPRETMEASEDYTRVIARGPNPRTTHIFDDLVVVVEDDDDDPILRCCHGCSTDLGQGNDIFMYRGEMAFCSHECHRYREMLLFDEQEESS